MKKILAAALAIGLVVGTGWVYTAVTEETIRTLITDKQRECSGSEDCKYIIYTTDETFKNVDSWWYLKFDSSDYYRELQINKQYDLKVYGFRIPFMSMYRNIVDYQEVPQ